VLGPLHNVLARLEEVGPLQSLESEEIVVEIPIEVDPLADRLSVLGGDFKYLLGDQRGLPSSRVDVLEELLRNFIEIGVRLLVQVRYGDAGRQLRVVGVHDCHVGAGLGCKIVEVHSCNTYEN